MPLTGLNFNSGIIAHDLYTIPYAIKQEHVKKKTKKQNHAFWNLVSQATKQY